MLSLSRLSGLALTHTHTHTGKGIRDECSVIALLVVSLLNGARLEAHVSTQEGTTNSS